MRDEKREVVWQYCKFHPCVDRGESDPLVLDFDHLREKRKAVSILIWSNRSLKYIQEEIAKCEVRCADCHRRRRQSKWVGTNGRTQSLPSASLLGDQVAD